MSTSNALPTATPLIVPGNGRGYSLGLSKQDAVPRLIDPFKPST